MKIVAIAKAICEKRISTWTSNHIILSTIWNKDIYMKRSVRQKQPTHYCWGQQKVVNFLDVTLDLTTEKYKPYSKPATTPLYVHSKSNHPPCIIKNIPKAINKRLSEISSDEEAFKEAAPPYQEALQKSGYSYTLKFTPPQQSPESTTYKRKRQRNIIWFNPPFSKNVQTNTGREFRNFIERCFPLNHKLRKLFNKNNLKLSYSCSPNIKQIIDGHNKTILSQNMPPPQQTLTKLCNCRTPDKCLWKDNA